MSNIILIEYYTYCRILSYYAGTFLVSAHRFGVAFPKLQKISEIFWALHNNYSQYKKSDTRNFCLFVYLRSYNDKSKFLFLETLQSSHNTSYLRTSHFCGKCQYRFFSCNIPLYIGKNPVEKSCKVLEMELKTHTPVGLKYQFKENLNFFAFYSP